MDMQPKIKIEVLDHAIDILTKHNLLEYATESSAGFDLRAVIKKPLLILPDERILIPTGIKLYMQESDSKYVGFITSRSKLYLDYGIRIGQGIGTISTDCHDEIKVILKNDSVSAFTLVPGEKIAQVVILPVCRGLLEFCNSEGESI